MIHSDTAKYYFAAMNTAQGFRGFFNEIFGDTDRLYIIKGGPGTGKSRFIGELGEQAELRGCGVEYFLCSSDPYSLDGVIITCGGERIGIIDGTMPHAYEPRLAGAKDTILNFGEFWDERLIIPHKQMISSLSESKSRLYSSAYNYLSAISSLDAVADSYMSSVINRDKLDPAICRLLRGCDRGARYSEKLRIRSGIGCGGTVVLDTYGSLGENLYAVVDRFGSAKVFMLRLRERLAMLGVSVTVSYSPFSPNVPDAIYIPSFNTAFYVGSEGRAGEHTVNMERFIHRDRFSAYKPKLKELFRQRSQIYSMLCTEMNCIGAIHSELESIYTAAMDFSKKELLAERTAERIFGTR